MIKRHLYGDYYISVVSFAGTGVHMYHLNIHFLCPQNTAAFYVGIRAICWCIPCVKQNV